MRWAARAAAVVLVAGVTYYLMFRLPFAFPPERRLMSASYPFGFNNSVAIVGLVAVLGTLTLLRLRRERAGEQETILFAPISGQLEAGNTTASPRDAGPDPAHRHRGALITLAVLALLYALLTLALYVYTERASPSLTWETRHFLYRTRLMDLYGLRPYIDFQAEYGPALVYAPLYAYRLLAPLGAAHEQAYFASHLVLNLAGLSCLYYLLSRAAMPRRARVIAMVLLGVAGFAPYMGLNGVLLRFLCPFASLLLGHRLVARIALLPGGDRRWLRWIGVAAAVLGLLWANVLLSPEVGLAFALAWLAYAVWMLRIDRRVMTATLPAFAAAALLGWAALPEAYYGSLLRFSEGANNLPLLPAPHLVLYLLIILLVVPPLLARGVSLLLRRSMSALDNGGNRRRDALAGAMGALCVVMAPGALGRCDPPHVLFYGMGASLLLLIRLANTSRLVFALYAATYGVVFIALLQLSNLMVFYGVSPRALGSRDAISHLAARLRPADADPTDAAAVAAMLERYPKLGLPFATYGDPAVEAAVLERRRLSSEYYIGGIGVYDEASLARKLRDVAGHEYLLVPAGFEQRWDRDLCQRYLEELKQWFLYPAALECRQRPLDPDGEVNGFIADHYTPVERAGGWVVLRRGELVVEQQERAPQL